MNTSHPPNASRTNGQENFGDTNDDILDHSVIVRQHDDSSSSTCEEMETETNTTITEGKPRDQTKRQKRKDKISCNKQSKDILNVNRTSKLKRRSGRRDSSANGEILNSPSNEKAGLKTIECDAEKKHKVTQNSYKQFTQKIDVAQMATNESKIKSTERNISQLQNTHQNLAMSPTVIIEELDMKNRHLKKRIAYSTKSRALSNEEISVEKSQKQTSIHSYFSPPDKKTVVKNKNGEENQFSHANSTLKSKDTESHIVEKDLVSHIKKQKLSRGEKDISGTDKASNCGNRRSVRSTNSVNSLDINYTDHGSSYNESAESEMSDIDSEKSDYPIAKIDNINTKPEMPFVLTKRGRRIGRPNYIIESSSEHNSDTEGSRTGSPALGKLNVP